MVLRPIPFFSFPIRISVGASHSLLFGICMTVSACSAASLAVEKHFRNFIRSLLTSTIVTHPFYFISSTFLPSEILYSHLSPHPSQSNPSPPFATSLLPDPTPRSSPSSIPHRRSVTSILEPPLHLFCLT
jgi:hypothetical protein